MSQSKIFKKPKIVLVADCKTWAFGFISKHLSCLLANDFDVQIIFTEDYTSYTKFLAYLVTLKADLVHFFWRGYLLEVAKTTARKKLHRFSKLLSNTGITTHVPEHLFVYNEPDIIQYLPIFHLVDSYFCTSEKLEKIYQAIPFYPEPSGAIHDITQIEKFNNNKNLELNNGYGAPITIAWVGNSKWCCDIGFLDPKGPYSVIEPAIEILKKENIPHVFNNFDKTYYKHSRETILEKLCNTDILLIASFTEGTPLPLLEAMACGCAIITSDTGIAREVLPHIQQPYIIPRNAKFFAESIKYLNQNRKVLDSLKQANYNTYWDKIAPCKIEKNQWKKFFLDAIEKSKNPESLNRKSLIFSLLSINHSSTAPEPCLKLKRLQKVKRRLNRPFLTDSIAQKAAIKLSDIYFKKIFTKKAQTLCIYSPYWAGVRNSTRGLFQERIFFPYASKTTGIKHHHQAYSIQKLLDENKNIKRIVFSGGDPEQLVLATTLKNNSAYNLQIYLLYHGSPAQWSENFFYEHIRPWMQAYQDKIIDGFLLLREDLKHTFNQLNLPAFTLKNLIPLDLDLVNCAPLDYNKEFRIGIWSASDWWGKNLMPQLMAAQFIPQSTLYTNCALNDSSFGLFKGKTVKSFSHSMRSECLREAIANTHMTLYVTHTECSPMIALESLAVGTPCLVGPTSFLYQDDDFLHKYLVVSNPDSSWIIYQYIQNVRKNYKEICERLAAFTSSYNYQANSLLNDFKI